MTSQQHFSYTAEVTLSKKHEQVVGTGLSVTDVQFLVPVKIDMTVNGFSQSIIGKMDYINKKLYLDDKIHLPELESKVFEYLKNKNQLPIDKFAAPEEVYDRVEEVQCEHQQFYDEHLGEE